MRAVACPTHFHIEIKGKTNAATIVQLQCAIEAGLNRLIAKFPCLAENALLLILDNCEHLVDACAHVAETLLRACPDLHILATSREPLRIGSPA